MASSRGRGRRGFFANSTSNNAINISVNTLPTLTNTTSQNDSDITLPDSANTELKNDDVMPNPQPQSILRATDQYFILKLKRKPGSRAKDKRIKEIVVTYTKAQNGKLKDKRIKEIVVTYTKAQNGKLKDMKFKVGNEKTTHKLSPNWLRNAPFDVIRDLLIGLFRMDAQCFQKDDGTNIAKADIVRMAFTKLDWVIDLSVNAKLCFNNSELSDIKPGLERINDIDFVLYYFLIAQERYLGNAKFIRTLDFIIEDCNFTGIIDGIWALFKSILYNHPNPAAFERSFQQLYLQASERQIIEEFRKLYEDQFQLETMGISFVLFKGIIIRNLKLIFISKLKHIIYDILSLDANNQCTIGTVNKYQIFCYSGAALATILHIIYGRKMTKKHKEVHIRLTKSLCITPDSDQYVKVPQQLRYENKGFMYIMAPCLLDVSNQILNGAWH
eukprot:624223_1